MHPHAGHLQQQQQQQQPQDRQLRISGQQHMVSDGRAHITFRSVRCLTPWQNVRKQESRQRADAPTCQRKDEHAGGCGRADARTTGTVQRMRL